MEQRVLVIPGGSQVDLAITRSLGRKGVKVFIGRIGKGGPAQYSRYLTGTMPLSGDKRRAADEILKNAPSLGITQVICTEEDWIIYLNEHRERLEKHFELLYPDAERFGSVQEKDRTLEVARDIGVPVPRTVHIRDWADVGQCRDLQFPVVLKPRHRDPRWRNPATVDFVARYVSNFDELERHLADTVHDGDYPLVQEFVEGNGVGVEVLMRDGRPVMFFQHRRIREFPPAGGRSVYCESVPLNQQLVDWSVALLQALRWDGVAMVEYRVDPVSGRAALMEVNGRFWGSLALAIAAGADFPSMLCDSSKRVSSQSPYKPGIRCRMLLHDTLWLISVWKQGRGRRIAALLDYLSAFRPGTRFFIWSWSDPLPGIMRSLNALLTALTPKRLAVKLYATTVVTGTQCRSKEIR